MCAVVAGRGKRKCVCSVFARCGYTAVAGRAAGRAVTH